jgi:competence protein ComEC
MPGLIIAATSGLALGILAGAGFRLEPQWALVLALFPAALGIGFAAAGRKYSSIPLIYIITLLLAGAFFWGIFLRIEAENRMNLDELAPWKDRKILLEGVLAEDVRSTGGGKAFVLSVLSVSGAGKAHVPVRAGGLVQVRFYPEETGFVNGFKSLEYGTRILAEGIISEPSPPSNPGEFDYRLSLRRQGIRGIMVLKSPDTIRILSQGGGNPLMAFSFAVKRKLFEVIRTALPESDASLLIGILLGEPSEMDEELLSAFRGTGTLHILAASGLNVGIVILFCIGLFRLMGTGRRWACFWALPLILLYTLICGASPSIVRAAIMGAMACMAVFFERENELHVSTFLAAFIMLIFKPFWIFDIGFQLSFVSVLSMLWLTPVICKPLSRIPSWLSMPLAVSLACQTGLWPLLAFYFNQFSIISPLANLLVVPAASLLLPMGLIQALLGYVYLPLSFPVAGINWLLMKYLENVVLFLDRLPGSAFSLPTPPAWSLFLYFLILGLMLIMGRYGFRLPREEFFLLCLALPVFLIWWQVLKPAPPLEITFLDVGEGEATCIRMPSGETALVDGGPKSRWLDRGEKTVLPFLRRKGIRRLESLIITHPHQDHIGGIPAIIREIPVKTIYSNGEDSSLPAFKEIKILSLLRNTPWQTLRAGQNFRLAGGSSVAVLNPSSLAPPGSREELNDNSLAFVLEWQKIRILFAGDIGRKVEDAILRAGMPAGCDLLKVAHQGSSGSTGSDFLKRVHPRYCVIFTGRKNRFNHPSKETLMRLEDAGVFVFRTDLDGAITVTSRGQTMQISTMIH